MLKGAFQLHCWCLQQKLEFVTSDNPEAVRSRLNSQGARLGAVKELRGKRVLAGKDREGNNIQISEQPGGAPK